MDETLKLTLTISAPLVGVLIGGLLTPFSNWILARSTEKHKANAERKAALFATYAEWLTSSRIMSHQIHLLTTALSNMAGYQNKRPDIAKAAVAEARDTLPLVRETLHSLHKLILLDDIPMRRMALEGNTTLLNKIYHHLNFVVLNVSARFDSRNPFPELMSRLNHAEQHIAKSLTDENTQMEHQRFIDAARAEASKIESEENDEDNSYQDFILKQAKILEEYMKHIDDGLGRILELLPRTMNALSS